MTLPDFFLNSFATFCIVADCFQLYLISSSNWFQLICSLQKSLTFCLIWKKRFCWNRNRFCAKFSAIEIFFFCHFSDVLATHTVSIYQRKKSLKIWTKIIDCSHLFFQHIFHWKIFGKWMINSFSRTWIDNKFKKWTFS